MSSLANFSRFGIDPEDNPNSQLPKPPPQLDVFFKICLAGESGSGKTSFSKATTQLLSTKPDVLPSSASTQHQYFYKIKNSGKLHLDVIDVGPAGEREMILIRRSLNQSLFVIFINLATVKQKVEKSLFGKRTDTVIFHNVFKQDLKKWINLAAFAAASSSSSTTNHHSEPAPFIVVGTHKDFLSHQDELALQTVVSELRSLTNHYASSFTAPLASSASSSSSSGSSSSAFAQCYGCFLSSCNDHSVFAENREGPKTIKQLWQFFCDLATKLVHKPSPSPTELQQQITARSNASLRSSLSLLRHERGLRAVTLHDLFLYSLTQGFTSRVMSKAIRKRQSLGDIALTKIRRGGTTKTSIVIIDLPSLSRVLNSLDTLRNRLAVLPPLVDQQQQNENSGSSNSNTNTNLFASSSNLSLAGTSSSLSSSFTTTSHHHHHHQGNTTTNQQQQPPQVQRPNMMMTATNVDSNSKKVLPSSSSSSSASAVIDEVIKQINTQEKRDQITQQGVVTWEMMSILGSGLIGGRCTKEEKASLFWQMTLCSGYFIPSISTSAAADCLLASSSSPQRHNNNHGSSSQSSSSSNAKVLQNLMGGDFNCSAFVCTIGTRRRVPTEALDQLDIVQQNFHRLTRRIVFSNELQFSKPNLFSLFIGRLVNISNVALLCPSHLFECGAWLRDRSLPSARLFVHMERPRDSSSSSSSHHTLTFSFLSTSETSIRAHAAFIIEVLHSIRAVFEDFEFHRIAKWSRGGSDDESSGNDGITSPKSKYASGQEDLSRLDLAFGS